MRLLSLLIALTLLLTSCATWSRTDKLLAVGSLTATAADYYTTKQVLSRPGTHEANPIYGSDPSDARLIGTMAASNLILMVLAHYYPELRKYILGGNMVLHGGAAIYNTQVD